MDKLTRQEEEAMLVIWKFSEGTVKQFLDGMPSPKPPYTTLASTVKNLEKKGYVNSRLIGNVYLYKPVINENDYKQKFMSGFVKSYFDNSYKDLVAFFASENKLSAKDLKEIIRLIEKNDK